MIILTSLHNTGYAQLAQATWYNNKIPYCERHGYQYYVREQNFTYPLGFEKIRLLLDLLEQYPETQWILWSGTDTLIMNYHTKVEEKTDHNYSIILSCDFNFPINNDVMLIQNTQTSKKFLNHVLSLFDVYKNHHYQEQAVMIDIMHEYANDICVKPQRYMNSYEYTVYRRSPWFKNDSLDIQGQDGQWHSGDWFIHWPGTDMHDRINLCNHFAPKIIQ